MKCGSLFSGIGGLDLGLERAGIEIVWQCESDPWRRKVLRERFPKTVCYEDVREAGRVPPLQSRGMGRANSKSNATKSDDRRESTDDIDLLCGGFPCEDVSVAGKRAGLAGDRTGLFWEFIRVARSIRPATVLLENVPGLLSSNAGRDFGTVLGALVELGYGVAWRIVDSRFFGVPQRRRRVFILGVLTDGDTRAAGERAAEILAVGSRCGRHPAKGAAKGEDVAVASLSGLGSGGPDDNDGQGGRLIGSLVKRYGKGADSDATDALVTHSLTSEGHDAGEDGTGRGTPPDCVDSTGAGGVFHVNHVRRLTPNECERLQAFPDGWTGLGPDSRRYAALGDAVTVNVAEWIGRRIINRNES